MQTDYAYWLTNRHSKEDKHPAVKPIPMPITKQQLYDLSDQLDDHTKSLFYALYLTGGRISEALELKTIDFNTDNPQQVTVKLNTRKKKRGFPFRYLPLKSNSPTELNMLHHLLRHKATYERLNRVKLYDLHRGSAWRKLAKIKFTTDAIQLNPSLKLLNNYEQHLYPHYLRHCRATHLVTDFGFNPFQLQQYLGWSSVLPAMVYVHLDWRSASNLLLGIQQTHGLGEGQANTPSSNE